MAEQEQDRTEQATPFKLEQATQRGSVAKSVELASFFSLAGALAWVTLTGVDSIGAKLRLDAVLLAQAHQLAFDATSVLAWLTRVGGHTLELLLPLLLLLALIAIIGTLVQTGPVFTFFPLKPDLKRLDPVAGFKRLFSGRLLYESGKTIVKLLLFSWALAMLFYSLVPALLSLLQTDPAAHARRGLELGITLVFRLLAVLALVALIDVAYTRWSWRDKLRMSRRELREELKNREGDPRIRARLRELRRELVKRARSMSRLPEADVLITNPVHVAVALRYRRETMGAPQLIAKGSGEAAAHMRALARRHGVPVVENRSLARQLFAQTALDQAIPPALFPQVARVLVCAYALRRPAAGGAR